MPRQPHETEGGRPKLKSIQGGVKRIRVREVHLDIRNLFFGEPPLPRSKLWSTPDHLKAVEDLADDHQEEDRSLKNSQDS